MATNKSDEILRTFKNIAKYKNYISYYKCTEDITDTYKELPHILTTANLEHFYNVIVMYINNMWNVNVPGSLSLYFMSKDLPFDNIVIEYDSPECNKVHRFTN